MDRILILGRFQGFLHTGTELSIHTVVAKLTVELKCMEKDYVSIETIIADYFGFLLACEIKEYYRPIHDWQLSFL